MTTIQIGGSATSATNPSQGRRKLDDAIKLFMDTLTDPERKQLLATPPPDPNSVLSFISTINLVKGKSNTKKLGDRFLPFLQFVQQFSGVVDAITQAEPNQIAGLVWGGVKVVIQVDIILKSALV